MEMQFVHTAVVDGVTKLAVVACFYEKGDRSPNFIKKLMRVALPKAAADAAELAPGLDFRVRAKYLYLYVYTHTYIYKFTYIHTYIHI